MKKFKELEKYSELNPIRDHIQLSFREVESGKELTAIIKELQDSLDPLKSRAIIFCTSRKVTEESAETVNSLLKENQELADKAGFYHAGMDAESRERTFNQYKSGTIAILFATKAFGMGMDIPNIHHVFHFGPSGSFEDYLQEVGRAGRNEADYREANFSIYSPIQAICFYHKDSFSSYRDWIQKTQTSWNDICNVYEVFKDYRSQFIAGLDDKNWDYLPIPLNVLSTSLKYMDSDSEVGSMFRLSLYWLQQAKRINSRYYVPAFLMFENEEYFDRNLNRNITDENLKKLFDFVYKAYKEGFVGAESTLVDGNKLMRHLEVNRDELFLLILKAQKKDFLKLVNEINVKVTENSIHDIKIQEISYRYKFQLIEAVSEVALKIVEDLREQETVEMVNENLHRYMQDVDDQVLFTDFLEHTSVIGIRGFVEIYLKCKDLRTEKKDNAEFKNWMNNTRRNNPDFLEILSKQRRILKSNKTSIIKNAFFVLNLHPGIKVTSKFSEETGVIIQEAYLDSTKKSLKSFIKEFCNQASILLSQLMKQESRVIDVNELLLKLPIKDLTYTNMENLLFLLKKVGYIRFQGGLVPMAIEIKFDNLESLGDLPEDESLRFTYGETIRMKKLRLIVLECFSELNDKSEQLGLILDYFQSKDSGEIIKLIETYSKNHEKLLGPYRAEALKEKVNGLNTKQLEVYNKLARSQVSVLAGPGTGKTHTLVLRVARLIQEENISPQKILVLAYNRSVVEELKMRLKKLFFELGYKKLIDSLQVYTFSALTGSVLQQNGVRENDLNVWEKKFMELFNERGRSILGKFSDVEYVFIDEFQDITNQRFEIIKIVAPRYRCYLTTIGDPNQSIYGFERVKEGGERGPEPYYAMFDNEYTPDEINLTINYRSTPEIIEASKKELPTGAKQLPILPNPDIEKFEGKVDIYEGKDLWLSKLYLLLKEKNSTEIAVLFRTNEELYRYYDIIKELAASAGFNIEIKGSSTSFTKQREIAFILDVIINYRASSLIENKEGISDYVNNIIKPKFPNWDVNLLDDFVRLFEYFYDQYHDQHTYGDFVDFVKEITAKDDGQLFKILKTQNDIITPTVILTTIHRVKGMEYETVILPSSTAALPFDLNKKVYDEKELQEIIDEEKRLRYVALSRAENNLIVEIDERERSMDNGIQFSTEANDGIGIPVKSGDTNVVVSWKAGDNPFFNTIHERIHANLKVGEALKIKKDNFGNFGLWQGAIMLEKFMDSYAARFNEDHLEGVYVDSIVRYTSEDCQRYDDNNGKNYYSKWSDAAKLRGYIYLVNFFGYAEPQNGYQERKKAKINALQSQ